MEFYNKSNGATITTNEYYVELWTLSEIIELNGVYDPPCFLMACFLFGSNGGGAGYGIEKATGDFYEIPYISLSKDEAIFRGKNFIEFLDSLNEY